ncbi:MAG: hypothetical protein JNL30_15775 [Rubrivivax sp.]|nr:hypothetical protein [Rubrivivax sp.]
MTALEILGSPYDLAVRAERVDTLNWLDMHEAAPTPVRHALGLAARRHGELAMVRSGIPFSHFNMVLTLGCPASVDEAAFQAIEPFYAGNGCGRHWVLVNEHSRPADLGQQLLARGYRSDGAWDRVILRGARPALWRAHGRDCEAVDATNAEQWIGFLRQCYGVPPPVGEWLRALVGRRGWHHMLRREGGRAGAPVVMARSAFVDEAGWAWLGVDAPVPGVMAPCFADDQQVTAALLQATAAAGAHSFVSDIEAPSPERQGPGYTAWGELGFEARYLRRLFVKG